jgi:YVTN family beta-propeller protein
MRRIATGITMILSMIIVTVAWTGRATRPVPTPIVLAVPGAALTHTLYLPLIAKPVPTRPYVLTTIQLPTGSQPHGVALDLAGGRAFVGNHAANTLSVIDTNRQVLSATIPLTSADGPNGVAYNADLDRVYVANRNTNNLSVVDPGAGSWLKNVAVGQMPAGVAVMDGLIYVANFGSDSISVISAQTTEVTATLSDIFHKPALTTVNEAEHLVFVSIYEGGYAQALRNGQLVPTRAKSTGTLPYGLAYDQVLRRLYTANRGAAHTVYMTDEGINWYGGEINVGQEPFVVGVNARTGHVFVVCGDVVKVYDRRDNTVIASIPVGAGAQEGIAVDAEHDLVYVTSSDTDQVTVIQDIPTFDLAFVSYVTHPGGLSHSNIFITDDAGQHVMQLTQASTELDLNWQPTFRPDGKALAFTSSREADHDWDVFTMDLLGHNQINLTNDGGPDNQEPAWSPDGSQIAWRRDWNIWVMNADGSIKVQLTSDHAARTPKWSPDGKWICFLAWPPGEMQYMDVYIVPASGGTPIDVTSSPRNDLEPNWSPDSREIVFETDRHNIISNTHVITYNWELYKVNISTTVQTRLTDSPGQDHAAAWSPDGAQIAFISDRGNRQYDYNLYVMDPDGTHQRRVTPALQLSFPLAWSSDSRRIAASTSWVLNGDIYTVDLTTNQIKLLNQGTAPTWRPDTWR